MRQPSDSPSVWFEHKTFSSQLQLYKALKFENEFINTQLQEELRKFLSFISDFYVLNQSLTRSLRSRRPCRDCEAADPTAFRPRVPLPRRYRLPPAAAVEITCLHICD